MEKRNEGQALIEALVSWLLSYMAMSRGYALTAALWCVGTWIKDQFDIVPYLAITAATKGAGKTLLAELMARLCDNGEIMNNVSGAPFYHALKDTAGHWTPFFDEAEITSREAQSGLGQVLNAGFRKGGTIQKVLNGERVIFDVFGFKAFIQIGDPRDTLRDRCILFTLTTASAVQMARKQDYSMVQADEEGKELRLRIEALARSLQVGRVRPVFLNSARDRDIWTPIFSLAAALNLSDAMLLELERVASETSMEKGHEKRRADKVAEDKRSDNMYAIKALRDLLRVMGDDKRVFSAEAVKRMRALPSGGWSKYRDLEGLTVNGLADLVERFGVKPKTVRIGGRSVAAARGYLVEHVRAAVLNVEGAVAEGGDDAAV